MKIPSLLVFLLPFCLLLSVSAGRAGTNSLPRLTVDLRDGSRVVGTSVSSRLEFHSELLGNLKLEVKDIRSVECLSSNSAKLTTTSGDTMTVSFVDPAVTLKTSFGKVNLTADSIRKLTVWAGTSAATMHVHLPGLVALWPAEGDARDSIGTNNGMLEGGLGFAPGEVGQAFSFNDANGDVKIPASASLNVGGGSGFTLEAWVNCPNVNSLNPIFEWNQGDGVTYWGVHFYVGAGGSGSLYANVVDNTGHWHPISSTTGIVASNVFTHAALTYDKPSGVATLYCNGVIVAQSRVGSFTPQTAYSLYLGRRIGPDAYLNFSGMIDKPSIYNRALSAGEIQDQCRNDNGGELPPPPPVPALTPMRNRFPGGFNE